jgi:nitroimidazol reductase NimA-like FMN-containing flavoprotein (pyridoxamine 5'-phosphate oxidase superfamily)
MTAATDHAGLDVLTFEECLELLRSTPVGRVAFASAGEVEVLPVNYTMDGVTIAFRCADGAKLGAAVQESAVTFQVDSYDDYAARGWSVLVKGTAEVVTDEQRLARLEGSGLRPYASAVPRPFWVAIHPNTVTGRRVPASG